MYLSVFLYKVSIALAPRPAPAFKLIHTHSVPTGHCRGMDRQQVRIQSAGVRVGPHVPQLLTRRTREPLAGKGTAQGPLGRAASQLTQGPGSCLFVSMPTVPIHRGRYWMWWTLMMVQRHP